MLGFVHSRLSISARILIICALFLAPLAALAYFFVADLQGNSDFASKELEGTSYNAKIWPTFLDAVWGDPIARGGFTPEASADALFGVADQAKAFAEAQDSAAALTTGARLIVGVADGSNLTLDPDLDSFYAMDAVTVKMPQLIVAIARVNESAARAAARAGAKNPLAAAIERLRFTAEGVDSSLRAAIKGNPSGDTARALQAATDEIKRLADEARIRSEAQMRGGSAADAGQARYDLVVQVDKTWKTANVELARLLDARLRRFHTQLLTNLAIAIAFLLGAAVVALAIARKLSERLRSLARAMDRLMRGDHEIEIPHTGDSNETGHIAQTLVAFKESLIDRNALRLEQERLAAWSQAEIRKQFERLESAIDNMPQGLAMFDAERRLIVCNGAYARMYRLPEALTRPGAAFDEILKHRIADGMSPNENAGQFKNDYRAAVADTRPWTRTLELKDGRSIAITHTPMSDGGSLSTHDDITERRTIDARIAHLATHDALTALPNRAHFYETLRTTLDGAADAEATWALLAIDLDRFKEVNDSIGHGAGDLLLRQVAERLLEIVGDQGLIARLGGDEFVVLRGLAGSLETPEDLARRIVHTMREPFDLDGHLANIGASVGIAVAPEHGKTYRELLRHADLALYRAKSQGRGGFEVYDARMGEEMAARRALEIDLKKGLIGGEFELYYQPLLNLATDSVRGFEALIRWNRPGHGLTSPMDFIPIAEETGLIVEIGDWVLRRACEQATAWPDPIQIAVNVSPVQFRNRNFVRSVTEALRASGLAASRLEIEITESAVISDADEALAVLTQLHDLGVRLALDDFGTGYSSLTSLRKYPFDRIKIDRSFIRDLANTDRDALEIVRSVASLGVNLGKMTTAEGVETLEQLLQVRGLGCTDIQGYLISAPRPASEIPGMILKGRSRAA